MKKIPKHVETLFLKSWQEVKDPKLKAKLTKQAQDEKELLDKCVQMQALGTEGLEVCLTSAADFPGCKGNFTG